jgi:hypothetical protein
MLGLHFGKKIESVKKTFLLHVSKLALIQSLILNLSENIWFYICPPNQAGRPRPVGFMTGRSGGQEGRRGKHLSLPQLLFLTSTR